LTRRSSRRLSRRPTPPRRKRFSWKTRLAAATVAAVLALLAWGATARRLAPASNTSLTRFDAIIVLGTAADNDGNPTLNQLTRVTEAVREYERGVAPRLILTGGAVQNRFVEARVMARTAEALGIPPSAILIEPEARDTIQNACYAVRILKAHGWRSAEIVSNDWHLPRAGIIFSRLPLEWRAHPAPMLSPPSLADWRETNALEILKTARYLVWARQTERCRP